MKTNNILSYLIIFIIGAVGGFFVNSYHGMSAFQWADYAKSNGDMAEGLTGSYSSYLDGYNSLSNAFAKACLDEFMDYQLHPQKYISTVPKKTSATDPCVFQLNQYNQYGYTSEQVKKLWVSEGSDCVGKLFK